MNQVVEHIYRGKIACGGCGTILYRNQNSNLQCLDSNCPQWRIEYQEPRISLTPVSTAAAVVHVGCDDSTVITQTGIY